MASKIAAFAAIFLFKTILISKLPQDKTKREKACHLLMQAAQELQVKLDFQTKALKNSYIATQQTISGKIAAALGAPGYPRIWEHRVNQLKAHNRAVEVKEEALAKEHKARR